MCKEPGDANKSTPLSDLYIDAGLTQEEGEALVGTFVVPKGPFRSLLGERVSAKALDDRAGFAALLQTAEYLQGKPLDVDLYLMGSTREEVNGGWRSGGSLCVAPPLLCGGGCDPRPHPQTALRRKPLGPDRGQSLA